MNNNPSSGIDKDHTDPTAEEADDFVDSVSRQVQGMDRPVSGKTEEKLGDANASPSAPRSWRTMP